MRVYVTHTVADAIVKMEKKPSYSNLRLLFYGFIKSHETAESWKVGSLLNRGAEWPFVKGRIAGRSGYRIYYLILIKQDEVIISAIYPKFGSLGINTLGHEARNAAYSDSILAYKSRDMRLVIIDDKNKTVIF